MSLLHRMLMVKLLEYAVDQDSIKSTLSHLSDIRVEGCSDHAKTARMTFFVPCAALTRLQKLSSCFFLCLDFS